MTTADAHDPRAALQALLEWYVDMGVDAAVGETPHDRFQPASAAPPPEPETSTPEPATKATSRQSAAPAAAVPADALVEEARRIAAAATTLDQLRAGWETLPGCNLAKTAGQMIFSDGTPGAPLMLIGAAPEEDDERQGTAFAGARGRLLDAMLRAIGLTRAEVYLANVIPWRPPGGRPPTPLELSLCLPFARRQIALAAPRLIVCLGERAAQPLLGSKEPISRLRGRRHGFEGEGETTRALVTFSLDYLLKQPLQKRRAWADLQMLSAELTD